MLELHGEQIVEEIAPRWREHCELVERRDEAPVHQRPCVVGAACAKARDERAKADLNQHGQHEYDGHHTKRARRRLSVLPRLCAEASHTNAAKVIEASNR